MDNQTIFFCVIALLLGMLLANMLKNVCGCKLVEGLTCSECPTAAMLAGSVGADEEVRARQECYKEDNCYVAGEKCVRDDTEGLALLREGTPIPQNPCN